MAITSISNSVESTTSPLNGQGTEGLQAADGNGTANNSGLSTQIQDSFTPSNQNTSTQSAAQEAGLFQVTPLALAAASAAALTQQATQLQPNQNPAPPQAAPVAAAAVQSAPTSDAQGQILAFNQSLAALGLTNNDIQKLDQIATLVNVFSPTAFNDLIRQFQVLAQQSAQLSAVNVSPVSPANSGGYQVEGLTIQFSDAQQLSNGAAAPGGNQVGGTQAAAPSLQLGSVQFTLTNAASQCVNIQAPQQKA